MHIFTEYINNKREGHHNEKNESVDSHKYLINKKRITESHNTITLKK